MKRRTCIGLLVGLALLAAACGNVAEGIAERAIEAESGGEVDIDFDDGGGDGEATIEFSDGEDDESGTMTIGGTELPDGFPIPVPDGFEVSSTSTFTSDDGDQYSAVLIWERGEFDRISDFYEDYFSGLDGVSRSEFSSDGTTTRSWSTSDFLTSVNVTQDDREVIAIIQAQG